MKSFKLRDWIFGGMGAYILYHEVVVVSTAEPLLIFAAFFLLGLIPASRADDATLNFKEIVQGWLGNGNDSNSSTKRGVKNEDDGEV